MDQPEPAPAGRCRGATPLDSLGAVIFGASGDLAARKLLPALYSLHLAGALPRQFFILDRDTAQVMVRVQHDQDMGRPWGAVRDSLRDAGILIEDTPAGARWSLEG